MATIRTKLKQLRDADVRFISLVDRAATRIPFRVLKRDKESTMGIDLTTVFKSDAKVKPHVSALVVFAQKNEDAAKQIEEAVKTHGFHVNRVQKSDEGETLVYAQTDQDADTHVVRLSDQTLVSVAGLSVPDGWMGDWIEKQGFFPDVAMGSSELHARLQDIVTKSDSPQADAEAILTSYAQYLNQVIMLPTAVFKLDDTIVDIVKKCSCGGDEQTDEAKKEDEKTEGKKTEGKTEAVKESPEERKKRIKDHPPAEMACADEDDDQKPPEDAVKSESMILKALKGIETTVTALTAKLDTVVNEQAEQKKALDGVVQKTDTLQTTLKATVTAPPLSEDRPSNTRMRIEKRDDDPRTGNFDTAFLRRNRR